jgi:hypothetical protein
MLDLDREEDEVVMDSKLFTTNATSINSDLLETVQSLKSLVILLKGLYGQINEEREIITLAAGQMAHSVKQFEQHLKKFEVFEKTCKQAIVERVKAELKQSTKETAQTIAEEVTNIAYEPINRGINSLCQLSSEMTDHRTSFDRLKFWRTGLFLSAALLGGVVSGFTMHYLTQPSKEVKTKLVAGEMLMRSWSKLTQIEKDKIMKS